MKKILAVALATVVLAAAAIPSIAIGGDDDPSFEDHFWEVIEVYGPVRQVLGVKLQANNVLSLTTSPAGNISAVVQGRHPWIESKGGTAYYERPDGTYDSITLIIF